MQRSNSESPTRREPRPRPEGASFAEEVHPWDRRGRRASRGKRVPSPRNAGGQEHGDRGWGFPTGHGCFRPTPKGRTLTVSLTAMGERLGELQVPGQDQWGPPMLPLPEPLCLCGPGVLAL